MTRKSAFYACNIIIFAKHRPAPFLPPKFNGCLVFEREVQFAFFGKNRDISRPLGAVLQFAAPIVRRQAPARLPILHCRHSPRPNAKRLVRCFTRARIACAKPPHSSQAPKIFAYAHAATASHNAQTMRRNSPRISAGRGSNGACARSHTRLRTSANHGVNCRISPI